jgi:diguanylate cyclase (GGDEF)-like protein/PAS domain S-box-containing protein
MKPLHAAPITVPDAFASGEAFLAEFAEQTGGLVSYVDAGERIGFASRSFAAWFGHTPRSILGLSLRELHGAEAYAAIRPWLERAFAGEGAHHERQATRRDGTSLWLSVDVRPHRDAAGQVIGVFTCAMEVHELKRTHDALGRALEEVASHIENTPLAVVEWSADGKVKRWSSQAEAIFGWTAEEVRGRSFRDFGLVHGDSEELIRSHLEEMIEGRIRRARMLVRNVTKDGRPIWCNWYSSAFIGEHGRLTSILALAEDVTARVEAEEQLRQAAVHDALTGLPNRNSLAARLEHAILRVNRSGDRLALLFIDLDRFKKVNDTLGHAAGDEVLRQAAGRIRACVREVDTVARLGGDEFVVLLETDVRPDIPGIIGERIRSAFGTPFEWKQTEVRCGASVGVSLYPDHARDPAALLASADEAMYRVKLRDSE